MGIKQDKIFKTSEPMGKYFQKTVFKKLHNFFLVGIANKYSVIY